MRDSKRDGECKECSCSGVCKGNDILARIIEQLRNHTLSGANVSLRDEIFDLMNEGLRHLSSQK